MANWPASITTFPTHEDNVDTVQASHVNIPGQELTAVMSSLGVGYTGSFDNLFSLWGGEHYYDGKHSDINADSLTIDQSVAGEDGLKVQVSGDTYARAILKAGSDGGVILLSDGTNTWDINIRKSDTKTLTISDNAAGNLTEIDLKTLLLTLAGDIDMAGGKRVNLRTDASVYSNATKELIVDDGAAGNLTEIDLKTALLTLAGNIGMAAEKYISLPDVSGGGANSGKFFGGNGGFMWFDGETTGDVTLDSAIDWRDRWISVKGYVEYGVTSHYPGAYDAVLRGYYTHSDTSSSADTFVSAQFYSQEGQGGAIETPGTRLDPSNGLTLFVGSSDGYLKLKYSNVGGAYAYGLSIKFSDDQGHV